MDIPMLDEEEWSLVWSVYQAQVKPSREHLMSLRQDDDRTAAAEAEMKSHRDGQLAALTEYERITGFNETNFNALFHHRISHHGPPCPRCGKVLRTAVASKCFECGLQLRQRDKE